jgi:hypothetical protein
MKAPSRKGCLVAGASGLVAPWTRRQRSCPALSSGALVIALAVLGHHPAALQWREATVL